MKWLRLSRWTHGDVMKVGRSVSSCAKVTLCLLNLWVLCVILVVVLGHWRVFDGQLSLHKFYDNSHLVVMRELKEETNAKTGIGPNASVKSVETANAKPTLQITTTLSPVQREIEERVSVMAQWCRRLHPKQRSLSTLPAERLASVMVDTRHNMLFCQLPGVALNDWKRIFIYLTGKVNVTSHLKISAYDAHSRYSPLVKKLSDFPPKERQKIVDKSLRILFVRDPFERLLSTFQNKFQARYSKYFHEAFGRRIVKQYRRNATKASLQSGSDVRFNEFVRFVLDSEHESDGLLNEHWERYYKQCYPCLLNYNFLGKFETLVDDTKEALRRSDALKELRPPLLADTFRNSEKTLKEFYQTLPASDLSRLWKMYYPDYNLFSYAFPDVLHSLISKKYNDY